jgi:AcrR family transcriptional regulator
MAFGSLDDLVKTALALSQQRGRDVADIPLTAIAAAAGISRSTLLRRLGGTRRTLDDAVRATGLEPGGLRPVRDRAIDAAARLMSDRGLMGVTLDAVATNAECSLPSLHAVFEGRDGLLAAVFDTYDPLRSLEEFLADRPADTVETVRGVIRVLVVTFSTEPHVLPAALADCSGRASGPGRQIFMSRFPSLFDHLTMWLTEEIDSGRFRPLPVQHIVQILVGPICLHLFGRLLLGPRLKDVDADLNKMCDTFTDAFLRAVAVPAT